MELEEIKARTDQAQFYRGWITSAYAQTEYILGYIIIQSLKITEYEGIGTTLPHGAIKRIKHLRKLIQNNGPFDSFYIQLREVLDAFEVHQETRNLLAHGFATICHTPDNDFGLEFRKWDRDPQRQDAQLVKTFRLVDLEYHKEQLIHISEKALVLLQNVEQIMDLKNQ